MHLVQTMQPDIFDTLRFVYCDGAVTVVDTPESPGFHWRSLPHWVVIHSEGSEYFLETADLPKHRVHHGSVVFVPPNTPHCFTILPHHKNISTWCHIQYPLDYGLDISNFMEIPLVIDPDETTAKIREIIEELAKHKSSSGLAPAILATKRRKLGFELLDRMFAKSQAIEFHPLSHQDSHRIVPVLEYINQSLDKNITRKSLVEMSGISTTGFHQLFKAIMGIGPMEYLRQTRMKKACQYLVSTDHQVSRIANLVGYPDQYVFSRAFKKELGVSPLNFRKNSTNDMFFER